jgi:hypothetical protein
LTPEPIYVASGLPRSGTSMAMRMLAAGGLPVLADERRAADSDNPRGYFELEAVKGTAIDASWVSAAPGRVVKVISQLLPHLPPDHDYRIVFLRRPLDQIVRSQRVMLERIAGPVTESDEEARRLLAEHLVDIDTWLATARHVRWLGVSYERVLAEPHAQAARIAQFLERDLDLEAMVASIEPGLRRQR